MEFSYQKSMENGGASPRIQISENIIEKNNSHSTSIFGKPLMVCGNWFLAVEIQDVVEKEDSFSDGRVIHSQIPTGKKWESSWRQMRIVVRQLEDSKHRM